MSMGLDSGSTSDIHRASNATTTSTLVILDSFIPFVKELRISVSCVAVNLNATNSIAFLSARSQGGGTDRS